MTDNEIIKALECCTNKDRKYCTNCPLKNEFVCVNQLASEAVDFINRQKAEIEKLKEASEEAVSCFHRMESLYNIKCMELKVAKAEAIKEFAERLKEEEFASGAFDEFATTIMPNVLRNLPAADVVEVVRCSDCKWFVPKYIKLNNGTIRAYTEEEKKLPLGVTGDIGINCGSRCLRCLRWEENSIPVYVQENDYCSYGERKVDNGSN